MITSHGGYNSPASQGSCSWDSLASKTPWSFWIHTWQQSLQIPHCKSHARASTTQVRLWIKRNCSARFGSQLLNSTWFSGLKMFPLDFQIMADFSDVFGPLNFIANLRQWPLDLHPVGKIDSGSWVHTADCEVQSCFISTMAIFWSIMFYFLKGQLAFSLVEFQVAMCHQLGGTHYRTHVTLLADSFC